MENEPGFRDALSRLPFTPLGPTNWRDCRRAIGGQAYGPEVGIVMLSLVHSVVTPERRGPGLSVSVSSQPRPPEGPDRAIRAALMRMTTLNPQATVTEQRRQTWDVLGQETDFRLVRLSDGQWSATAVTGERSIGLNGDWPLDGLRLVEVDPLMYGPGVSV